MTSAQKSSKTLLTRFCPNCGNLLGVTRNEDSNNMQMSCQTCPYVATINKPRTVKVTFDAKKQDDVYGGENAWDNVDSTEATCPKCGHMKAYFYQVQIRSADEPMSTFYKCCECGHKWREG